MRPYFRFGKVNTNIFNCLPTVEEANAEVTRNESHEKAEFLMASSAIFGKYSLHEKLGVRLLHRHNSIERDEHMIESRMIVNGEAALVSTPLQFQSGLWDDAVPTVWAFVDGQYEPLEYSTDPLARKIFSELDIADSVLDEFRNLTISSPIGKFLGLSIVDRQFYEGTSPDMFPLEYTDGERRRNVIYLRESTFKPGSIETAWSFNEDLDEEITLGCISKSYCAQRCRTGCWPDGKGNHDTVHDQRHGPSYSHEWDGGP